MNRFLDLFGFRYLHLRCVNVGLVSLPPLGGRHWGVVKIVAMTLFVVHGPMLVVAQEVEPSVSARNTGPSENRGLGENQEIVPSTNKSDEWRSLVGDLHATEFAKRELASTKLGTADFSAMVQVLPLLTAEDAEVAWRAKEVLIQQGIRGPAEVVRRIGLVLKLLTAAGHREFAEDSERFASRIANIRVTESVRALESIPQIMVTPGPLMGNMIVAGNVLRIQGGIGIGQGQIQMAPQAIILRQGAPVELFEVPNKVLEGENGEVPTPVQGDPSSNSSLPVAEASDDRQIRLAYLNENLPAWLEQCVTANPDELAALESSWQETGLITASTEGSEQPIQSFDLIVNRTLDKNQVATFGQFLRNPVMVSLNMNEVEMSPELQALIIEAAEAGKIQYLNTVKCGYDLATCAALMETLTTGKLGYWHAQGRAMLGIKGDNLLGRDDSAIRGGAMVGEVTKGSAAQLGGIRDRDVIRRINDMPVENFEELRRIVSAFDVGDKIKVELTRADIDRPLTLEVELMQSTQ